ncbi:hypothetical protein CsSME_00048137 [Camellia sinensis var. sinensis]
MDGGRAFSPSGELRGSSIYGRQRKLIVVRHGRRSDEPGRQGFVCQASHRRRQLYGEQIFRQARIPFFRAPSMSDHLRASNGELPGSMWPEKPSDNQVSTHLRIERKRERGV